MFDNIKNEADLEPLILAGRLCFALANRLQSEGDTEAALRLRKRATTQALLVDELLKQQANAELTQIAERN